METNIENVNDRMLALSGLRRAETDLQDAARAFVFANPSSADVAAAMGEEYDRQMERAQARLETAALAFAEARIKVARG